MPPARPARSAGGRRSGLCYRRPAMATVPIDEGPRDRRRIGPFWIEEGTGLLVVGAGILAVFAVLYVLAVLARPH